MRASDVYEHFTVYQEELYLSHQSMTPADVAEFERQCAYWQRRSEEIREERKQAKIATILAEAAQ
jgi:hypothetical protein